MPFVPIVMKNPVKKDVLKFHNNVQNQLTKFGKGLKFVDLFSDSILHVVCVSSIRSFNSLPDLISSDFRLKVVKYYP